MRVTVEQIGREKEEQVLIQCHEVTESIREIERFVKLRQRAKPLIGHRFHRFA